MSGCDWQNKSFIVAVMDRQKIICRCGKETDESYKHNGEYICCDCFSKTKSFGIVGFNTDKDKKYEFTTEMFNGKPIQIRSKGQFKSLLKDNGMVDASVKECFDEARFRKRINEDGYGVERRKKSIEIFRKMKEREQFRGRK